MTAPMLTKREREVLVELCRPRATPGATFTEPATTADIARALFVTEAAVKQHLLRLYDKLELHDDSENRRLRLANLAFERGLVTLADIGAAGPATDTSALAVGRSAFERRAWDEAFVALSAAAAAGALAAEDLERLADAAMWSGRPKDAFDGRQRAYAAYVAGGNQRAAARVALGLVINCVTRRKLAVAGGWIAKARGQLESIAETPEHGMLEMLSALALLFEGKLDAATECIAAGRAIAARQGDRDVTAIAQSFEATILTLRGRTREAMPLFDEAMASAASGELGPLATGLVYCRTLCSCIDVFDYRRAKEWTDVVEEARVHAHAGGFIGDCRAHRAAILAMTGDWTRAIDEARRACDEAETFDLNHVGIASYELGELRMRAGALAEASEAFERAHSLGHRAEPGMSLVRLAEGDAAAALVSIRGALAEVEGAPLRRARLLPAVVEIGLAAGACDVAEAAAGELARIAHDYGSRMLQAAADQALGVVAAARGKLAEAIVHLRASVAHWSETEAAFDAARARHELARVLVEQGDHATAQVEVRAAMAVFERLGAGLELVRAAATHALTSR